MSKDEGLNPSVKCNLGIQTTDWSFQWRDKDLPNFISREEWGRRHGPIGFNDPLRPEKEMVDISAPVVR